MPKPSIPFETLIADLHGPDWQKRCDAARMLGMTGDPRAVDALLPDLKDSDWRVRRNAAQALGALKSPRAVEGLKAALNDRTATVRERAAVALGRIKDPETLPILIEAVIEEKGAQFHVNQGAYQAVRKFGRKAGPHLVEALKRKQNIYLVELLADSKFIVESDFFISLAGSNDPVMRRAALTALSKTNDPRAVSFLTEVLTSGDLESQVLAIQTLTKLRAVQAIPALLGLLQGDQLYGPRAGLHRAVCDAMREFSGIDKELEKIFPAKPSLTFGVAGARTSLSEMMGMLGNDNFQKLNERLANAEKRAGELTGTYGLPPEVFQAFASQTWKFGAMLADARDAKVEEFKILIESLKSDSALTRVAAALSLPWYLDAEALEPLERAMSDTDETVQGASTWAYMALRNTLYPGE